MAITKDECIWLDKIKANIDKQWEELNDWEKKFIEDMLARYDQYGQKLMVSPKQWTAITKISDKII